MSKKRPRTTTSQTTWNKGGGDFSYIAILIITIMALVFANYA